MNKYCVEEKVKENDVEEKVKENDVMIDKSLQDKMTDLFLDHYHNKDIKFFIKLYQTRFNDMEGKTLVKY